MSYIIPNILTLGPGKRDSRKCMGMDMLAKGPTIWKSACAAWFTLWYDIAFNLVLSEYVS